MKWLRERHRYDDDARRFYRRRIIEKRFRRDEIQSEVTLVAIWAYAAFGDFDEKEMARKS